MVGVPGGSRGCSNCKRRKIKCDETFPKCRRCIKANLECSGPSESRAKPSRSRPSVLKSRPTNNSPMRQVDNQLDIQRSLIYGLKWKKEQSYASILHESAIRREMSYLLLAESNGTIPKELTLFPEYSLYSFCLDNMINRLAFMDDALCINAWYKLIPQLVLSTTMNASTFAARSMVLSVCSTLFDDNNLSILSQSWHLHAIRFQQKLLNEILSASSGSQNNKEVYYASSIDTNSSSSTSSSPNSDVNSPLTSISSNLISMIGNVPSPLDDCTLAGLLLCIYELYSSTSEANWARMMAGTLELVRMNGPEKYTYGDNKTLFETFRPMLMQYSIIFRVDTFLSEPGWSTIPWQQDVIKDELQTLTDIGFRLAPIARCFEKHLKSAAVTLKLLPGGSFFNVKMNPPTVRAQFINDASLAELRGSYQSLVSIESEFNKWFESFSRSHREAVISMFHIKAEDNVEMDQDSCCPLFTHRICPLMQSKEEWIATHFFKPDYLFSSTMHAKKVLLYYSLRIYSKLLLELSLCILDTNLEELQTNNGELDLQNPGRLDELEQVRADVQKYATIICRSVDYVLKKGVLGITANLLFPLCLVYVVRENRLDRGWIYNKLDKLTKLGLKISMIAVGADIDGKKRRQWLDYQSLDICPGCGEQIRNRTN
ncbi:uncharacterized protein V1516DRAFT_663638 [Lipomyces oligophaga]|uniref:uncharacterized protein n=1 Tax=Lipomyces oligophaga TaxID=45792 RepID=UPI0034CE58D5